MKKIFNTITLLSLSLLLFSCGKYTERELDAFNEEIDTYLADSLADFKKSESGLRYKIINEGEGEFVKPLDQVTVKYSGRLLANDSLFHDTTLNFNMRVSIDGFKEGFSYFKKNGKGQLVIPPNLAYGKQAIQPLGIPKNACLVYEFEILDVE